MGNKQNMDEQHGTQNIRLKNFFSQKNISLINNNNIKEVYLGVKRLYLNRKDF